MGTDYMASVRVKPWHGLGAILANLATAEEMVEAARLGWIVVKEPATRINAAGRLVTVPDEYWTIRTDTDFPLGRVGKDYTILQNRECFGLMDAVTMDKYGPKYETAGSLRNGCTTWALLRLPGFIEVTPRDHVHEYILIVNTHDGSKSVTVTYTSVRVVCNNTLNMALKSGEDLYKMKHFSGMLSTEREDDIRNFLGIVNKASEGFIEQINTLQNLKPTKEQVDEVLSKLFTSSKGTDSTRVKNIKKEVIGLVYDGEANRLAGNVDNGWALLNGITEYAGYFRTVRATMEVGLSEDEEAYDRAEARFDSSFFGDGNRLKDKAFSTVLALAK